MKTIYKTLTPCGYETYDVVDEYPTRLPFTEELPLPIEHAQSQVFDWEKQEWVEIKTTEFVASEDLLADINTKLQIINLTDEQALIVAEYYPEWQSNHDYHAENILKYDDMLYRVVQDHSSQEQWTPSDTESLYTEISIGINGYDNWHQPSGVHDSYAKGDRVNFDGLVYESLIEGNTYSPTEYTDGWQVVEEE